MKTTETRSERFGFAPKAPVSLRPSLSTPLTAMPLPARISQVPIKAINVTQEDSKTDGSELMNYEPPIGKSINIRDIPISRNASRFPSFRTPEPKKARPSINYSSEQRAPIECNDRIIVTKACAGSGKTTMAVGFAEHRPKERGLFVAFGKSTQLNAVERFPDTVDCRTFHSLGYQAFGRHFKDRTTKQWRAMNVRDEYDMRSIRSASVAQAIIKSFFQSTAIAIGPEHVAEAETNFRLGQREIDEGVQNAQRMWRRMCDKNDKVSIPDDAYLKMWALTKPTLNYDYIILDEYQDANPIVAQVMGYQTHAQRIYIGDPHQSIYAFRGAANALDDLEGATKFNLTQTWRFGPRTANIANLVLSELKGEKIAIKGMGVDSDYVAGAPITKIARTNAELINEAVMRHGKGVNWVGGVERYQFSRFLDAYKLFARQTNDIKDPFVRRFNSWAEMQTYASEARDSEAKSMVNVIEKYHHDTPRLVEEVKSNAVTDEKNAEIVLTTGHQSKGLDWDYVELCDDFKVFADAEAALAQDPGAKLEEQEINLFYVVATRAKKHVQLNGEATQWIHDLPKHRKNRELALQKAEHARITRARAA